MPSIGHQLYGMGYKSYEEYLASPHWLAFKAKYAGSGRPTACAVCGCHPTELHHTTYLRLGCERLDDVTPLCRTHHERVHWWLKENGRRVEATEMAVRWLRTGAGSVTLTTSEAKRRKAKEERTARRAARREAECPKCKAEKSRLRAAVARLTARLAGRCPVEVPMRCEACDSPNVVTGHYLCGPCLTGEADTAGRESDLILIPATGRKPRGCCNTPRGKGPHEPGCLNHKESP